MLTRLLGLGLTALIALHAAADELPIEPTKHLTFDTNEGTWLSLTIAPDGEHLVFDLLGDLYELPISGGEAKRLTHGPGFDGQPAYSPNGDWIAFVSDRSGRHNLWIMRPDGSGAQRLSDAGAREEFTSPSFSPDSSHVVVSKTDWGQRTYELWAYHVKGGEGVRITKAKANKNTPANKRHNALGAVYGQDGRFLYYAVRRGGFEYNAHLPMWQIARRDLIGGEEDVLTQEWGSAFRPQLSPDGRWLAYGTRSGAQTGIKIRDLDTGATRWLAYPVTRDEQESRFTRDLLPGYAFTPDSASLVLSVNGGFARIDIATGEMTEIPFTATVDIGINERLDFPYRLATGDVTARLIRDAVLSPDGTEVAFSAFARIYVHDLERNRTHLAASSSAALSHPAFSPDGRDLVWVSWSPEGGHIWRGAASGRGTPERLTEVAAAYFDPVFAPNGERIVALRSATQARLYRESDFGQPVGMDVIWLPADGGPAELVLPSRGLARPHFGPEDDRIYLYLGDSGRDAEAGLTSVRFDGTDRRRILTVKGPGLYAAEEPVPATDVRISPDGRWVLAQAANQLYLIAMVNARLTGVTVELEDPSLPLRRLTDVGADFFGWSADGATIYWSAGHHFYRRALASIAFDPEEDLDDDNGNDNGDSGEDGDSGDSGDSGNSGDSGDSGNSGDSGDSGDNGDNGDSGEEDERSPVDRVLAESDPAVDAHEIVVTMPRAIPSGSVALVNATVLPMTEGEPVIADGAVVVRDGRIAAVGEADAVDIPADAEVFDLDGHYLLPGFINTHAHYRPMRRVLELDNWAFLANLAFGVTTGLDVQPSTVDILVYQDLIAAGLMLGPRALSTGPAIFSDNDFRSKQHAYGVLKRYRDHYRVHNLKAYIVGSRKQRQWLVQAARDLELMPTSEGALDMRLDLTHAIDGFSGNEHNLPVAPLYRDVIELYARTGIGYTPTLLVTYGGPWAENYFYETENPRANAKLRRFTPPFVLDPRTLRRPWFHSSQWTFPDVAASAREIVLAGGRVGVGGHGQLQGLGYHWEMWALAMGGFTPMEVLVAATRVGADMIGLEADLGTLEPGKVADLVVLEENPLEDIRNSTSLSHVMKNGELFEADTLDQLWPERTQLPERWWWDLQPEVNTR